MCKISLAFPSKCNGAAWAAAKLPPLRYRYARNSLAGAWAHHAQRLRQILEPGDIEEALHAASSIGDDRLQRENQGYVTPESFTHGTSAQPVSWFKQGYRGGELSGCDTFKASSL